VRSIEWIDELVGGKKLINRTNPLTGLMNSGKADEVCRIS